MRLFPSRFATTLVALSLIAGNYEAAGAGTEKTPVSRRTPITEAIKNTKEAVVAVKVPNPRGGKDQVGSGVIVDERGYIITNNHVVGTCKAPRVELCDGTSFTAEVLFAEARWDLAVLKVDAKRDLFKLTFAPSDDLMVGETVIAVGHPYGYSNTASVGIISALDREITMPTRDVLTGLIQTTASINPGNSGGPLLNINGELIGIVCCIRQEAQGIAFAINSGTANMVLSKMLSAERISGVNHGLACKEKVLGETGDRQRVVVSNFAGQNLQKGDEILSIGERAVSNAFDVERSLWDAQPGETVQMKVARQGKVMTVALTLAVKNGAGQAAAETRTTTQPVFLPTARIIGVSE